MGRTEKAAVRLTAIFLIVFSLAGILILWTRQGTGVMARQRVAEKSGSLMDYLKETDQKTEAVQKLHSLRLVLPVRHSADSISIRSQNLFTEYTITIPDITASYFTEYPVSGNGQGINDLTYEMDGDKGVLTLTTNQSLFLEESVSGSYVFFDFKDIRDYFDKVVVIDAGHGGNDNGCMADGVYEKDLTLEIVKKFKQLTDQNAVTEVKEYGNTLTSMQIAGVGKVGFFYTRLSDKKVYLRPRREMAEKLGADLFLSVHINSTSSGRESSINGGQVLYKASDKTGESKKFADIVMNQMAEKLGCRKRGAIAGDNIYIVRTAKMPVALAEIGFITNKTEREKLLSDDYQEKTAQALLDAITEYLG